MQALGMAVAKTAEELTKALLTRVLHYLVVKMTAEAQRQLEISSVSVWCFMGQLAAGLLIKVFPLKVFYAGPVFTFKNSTIGRGDCKV